MEAIFVALIASIGGVLAALVQKGRKENRDDHNTVSSLLYDVKDDIVNLHYKVDKVDDKIDGHIQSHRRKKIILVLI
jgi:hypothetical protein